MSNNPPRFDRRYSDNPTAGYRSRGTGFSLILSSMATGEPWFTWYSVPIMCRDNAVKYGLKQLRIAYQSVDIAKDDAGRYKIAAKPEVARYILKTWRTFWRKSLPRLLDNYNKWGRAPGGVEWLYDKRRRRLTLDQVRSIDPFDANPWVYNQGRRANQFCGFDLRLDGAGQGGRTFVGNPHAFYFSGNENFGPFCDEPALAAAFIPWQEKNAPMGLRSSRRLQAFTKAVGITVIRHPNEMVTLRDGRQVHSEELATQFGNALMNGSVVGMPSDMIPDSSGLRRWDIDQRTAAQGEVKTGELVKDADEEIWFGMGIPPEIIRAGGVGSGYAGRAVPMECWLGGVDEGAGLWDRTFRTQTLEPGIRANFGRVDPYDYELKSLHTEYVEQQKRPNNPTTFGPQGAGQQQDSQWQTVGTTAAGHQKQQNDSGQTRYLSTVDYNPEEHPRDAGGRWAPKPEAADVEAAEHKQIKPGVSRARTAAGHHYAVKRREGIAGGAATEELVSRLAGHAGVTMPPSHRVKTSGGDSLVTPWVEGKPLDAMTDDERKRELQTLKPGEIDRQVLFDYLVGHGDVHRGNFIKTPTGELAGIDKEMSLAVGGMGNNTHFKVHHLLDDVAPQGAGLAYKFDPAEVAKMAHHSEKLAGIVEAGGDRRSARNVRDRGRVLKKLAENPNATAGDLWKLGRQGVPSSGGFIARLFGG